MSFLFDKKKIVLFIDVHLFFLIGLAIYRHYGFCMVFVQRGKKNPPCWIIFITMLNSDLKIYNTDFYLGWMCKKYNCYHKYEGSGKKDKI